jgi:hypothetical protein
MNGQGVYCSRTCRAAYAHAHQDTRFWRKVRKTRGCWSWTGPLIGSGYGSFQILNGPLRVRLAHRFAYMITHGPIPPGMMVLHSCDNRACVNPAHLRLGTAEDNRNDMISRHRTIAGEAHPYAKLSNAQVIKIRKLYLKGWSSCALAKTFGVSRKTVRDIGKLRSWKHI